MKPGELERNLARLVEMTREAQGRLSAAEREAAALRLELDAQAPSAAAVLASDWRAER